MGVDKNSLHSDKNMGKLLDSLNDYFENTPQEVLDSDFKEMAHLNDIGPDAIEYAEHVKYIYEDNKNYRYTKEMGANNR